MNEKINLKGYLKVETLDAETRNVLDTWEDPNLIMVAARQNMAGLVAGFTGGTPINKLVLGEYGAILAGTPSVNILSPKTAVEGFNDKRTQLFSENLFVGTEVATTTGSLLLATIAIGEVVKYTAASGNTGNGIVGNYYKCKVAITSVDLDTVDFTVESNWESLGTKNGFFYESGFTIPNTWTQGDNAFIGNDGSTLVNVEVLSETTTFKTTFTYEIQQAVGNNGGAAIYTECAMYAGDDLFSMRTFPAKIKDSSVILKITWSIIF